MIVDVGGIIQFSVYLFSGLWAFILGALYWEDRNLVSILPSPSKSKKK